MKPIVATHSETLESQGFSIVQGEKGPIVDSSFNGIHLSIFPRGHGDDSGAYNIVFCAEKPDGSPDFGKIINSSIIDLRPDDVEEVAATYVTRLRSGIKPEEMFRDQQEANRRMMMGEFEKLKNR
jgi:hypothetical protein